MGWVLKRMMTKQTWYSGKGVLTILAAGVGIGLVGCSKPQTEEEANEELREGQIEDRTYHTDKIGWTMKYPEGWVLLTREEADGYTEKGQEMLQESAGQEIEMDGLIDLLNLKRDQFHVFQSTIEPYNPEVDGDWSETNASLRQLLIDTFRSQGIRAEATDIEKETVGGLEFETYRFQLFSPDGQLFMEQVMYSRFIEGYDFGVNISYQNQEHGEQMIEAFRASTFDTP